MGWKTDVDNQRNRKENKESSIGNTTSLETTVKVLEAKVSALLKAFSSGKSFEKIGTEIKQSENELENEISPMPLSIDEPKELDTKFIFSKGIDISRDIVEHSLNMSSMKSRNVTKQATIKQGISGTNLLLGLASSAVDPKTLALQGFSIAFSFVQEQQQINFERDQKNREAEITKSTLGTITSGGGRK